MIERDFYWINPQSVVIPKGKLTCTMDRSSDSSTSLWKRTIIDWHLSASWGTEAIEGSLSCAWFWRWHRSSFRRELSFQESIKTTDWEWGHHTFRNFSFIFFFNNWSITGKGIRSIVEKENDGISKWLNDVLMIHFQ